MSRALQTAEIKSLTGLRGIAALYVVGYHLTRNLEAGYARAFFDHGYLAVDLFFILSGFVMALVYNDDFANGVSRRGYVRFVLKRLGRIYPMYLFGNLTMIIVVLCLWHKAFGRQMILTNLLLINEWGLAPSIDLPGWSISAEFMAYLLFPFVSTSVAVGNRCIVWLFTLSCIGCLWWLTTATVPIPEPYGTKEFHELGSLNFSWFGFCPLVRCLAEFGLGMVACRLVNRSDVTGSDRGAHAALTVVFGIVLLMQIPGTDVSIVLLFGLLIIALAQAPLSLLSRFLSAQIPYWLGLISYFIYMMHMPVFALLGSPLEKILHRHPGLHMRTALSGTTIVPILLVSALCYYGIEKPCRELSRKYLGGRPISMAAEPGAP